MKVRFYVNQLQLIMPISQDLIIHMKKYGISGPFLPIPNTVDTEIFSPGLAKSSDKDGIKRILVVSRLSKEKGVDLLLRALAILNNEGRNFQLLIVGDGPERGELESMVSQLDLSNNTTFLGFRNRDEVAALMRQADLLAMTSYWDNQPVAILEALASGLPVLASNVGGIPEILPPAYGRLAEPGNITAIKEQLQHFLDNVQDYSSEAIVGYAREKFSFSIIGQAYSNAYQQVVQDFKL
jgi:glycosyltransferase involved in cell wall biosynthesis